MHRILLIEDDRDTRLAVSQSLEVEGYKVFVASNGKDGLAVLRKIATPCLILLDMMMPQMNGEEFLRAKRKDPSTAPIPVVVISAQSKKAAALEVNEILEKPFGLPSLLKTVRTYCA